MDSCFSSPGTFRGSRVSRPRSLVGHATILRDPVMDGLAHAASTNSDLRRWFLWRVRGTNVMMSKIPVHFGTRTHLELA